MNEFLEKMLEEKDPEEMADFIVKLNKFQLNRKNHIKKYNKIRKLHADVLESMDNYILSGKYDYKKYDNIINNDLSKVVDKIDVNLDLNDFDDKVIFLELFIYDNHPMIKSLTDIYLEEKKFKNEQKVKMLEAMKNSVVGLFEVVDVDANDGYITYQDVFTKKKYKTIDIGLSSTYRIDKNRKLYLYNRIINYEDICFATGTHCIFTSQNKELKKYIKSKKIRKCSNFIKCLILYDISKKDNRLHVSYNNRYGNR